jgi:hypothetical protein
MSKNISSKKLCKRCNKLPRHSLTMCEACLTKHNKATRELKHRLKAAKRCVNCGKSSDKYICAACTSKQVAIYKNSFFLATRPQQNILKQIMEISQ